MLALLSRLAPRPFGKRRIVRRLPRLLKQLYGGSECYTAGQVARAARELRIGERLLPYALAAACDAAEFGRVRPELGENSYHRLRAELVARFDLPGPHFTMRQLARSQPTSSWGDNTISSIA
jgi:hypothetical protein